VNGARSSSRDGCGHVVHSAKGDGVELAGGGHGFDAAGPHFRGESEGADGLAEESSLFVLRFGEGDLNVGPKEGDREAGEAGPGAEVEKCEYARVEVTRGEETLAEVAADDLFGIADGGEIGAGIPFEEKIEISSEAGEEVGRGIGKIRCQEIGYGGL
jgi:hypothetical protein